MPRFRPVILVVCVVTALLFAWFKFFGGPPTSPSPLPLPPRPAPAATTAAPASPGPPDTLNVVGTYPLGDDLVKSEVNFYFDKTVQWPKQADTAPEMAAVVFAPPLEADVRVQGHVISCKLKEAIPPGVGKLKAKLQPALQSVDGKPLDRQRTEWEFDTKRLEVKLVAAIAKTAAELTLGLQFSVPVTREGIQPCLQVLAPGGASIPFSIEQGNDSFILNLRLPLDVNHDAKIVLKDCAVSADGTLKVRQQQEYALPRSEALAVQSLEWDQEASPPTLWLSFSNTVPYEEFKSHIEIADDATGQPLTFELPSQDAEPANRFPIQFGEDLPPNPAIRVTIKAGLTAANGAQLAESYAGKTRRPAPRTAITGTDWHPDWQHEGRDGLILDLQLSSPVPKDAPKDLVEVNPPIERLRAESRYQTISVYGDWDSGQRYEIKVNLPSGVLTAKTAAEKVPPYVEFGREGEWYFPRRPGRVLTLQTRNADTVTVMLYRMFPSNVAVALQEMNSGKGSATFNYQWAEKVAEKEVRIAGPRDRMTDTPVDLDSLFPADKLGVFCIEAIAPAGGAAHKMALWANLGLLAYWQKDRLALFAHDLYSLAPASSAKVSVYSIKNQLLGQAETEANGIVRMGPFNTALGEPRVAVVEREGDYTFLELKPREQQDEDKSADLQPFDRKAYDAFVYADRNLYRPGEPVHAYWLVRTNYGDAASNAPLIVSLIKPNGKELVSQPTTLSALGAGGIDFATQRDYPTGKYTVQLSVPGNKKDIGAYQFSLEEFVPNTIKTTVTMDKSVLVAGQDQPVQLNAQHLFGAPASGRKAEI
ncbi:MAG: MG2 domain-containing protein, partial [Candidatus Hydrogenedentes bacterium]|nr:MG2 domain-containing protein [Candidatus Hydrogenedentota bacterium]